MPHRLPIARRGALASWRAAPSSCGPASATAVARCVACHAAAAVLRPLVPATAGAYFFAPFHAVLAAANSAAPTACGGPSRRSDGFLLSSATAAPPQTPAADGAADGAGTAAAAAAGAGATRRRGYGASGGAAPAWEDALAHPPPEGPTDPTADKPTPGGSGGGGGENGSGEGGSAGAKTGATPGDEGDVLANYSSLQRRVVYEQARERVRMQRMNLKPDVYLDPGVHPDPPELTNKMIVTAFFFCCFFACIIVFWYVFYNMVYNTFWFFAIK